MNQLNIRLMRTILLILVLVCSPLQLQAADPYDFYYETITGQSGDKFTTQKVKITDEKHLISLMGSEQTLTDQQKGLLDAYRSRSNATLAEFEKHLGGDRKAIVLADTNGRDGEDVKKAFWPAAYRKEDQNAYGLTPPGGCEQYVRISSFYFNGMDPAARTKTAQGIVYHEMGHTYDKTNQEENPFGAADGHDFNMVIKPRAAFSEGWANFVQIQANPAQRDEIREITKKLTKPSETQANQNEWEAAITDPKVTADNIFQAEGVVALTLDGMARTLPDGRKKIIDALKAGNSPDNSFGAFIKTLIQQNPAAGFDILRILDAESRGKETDFSKYCSDAALVAKYQAYRKQNPVDPNNPEAGYKTPNREAFEKTYVPPAQTQTQSATSTAAVTPVATPAATSTPASADPAKVIDSLGNLIKTLSSSQNKSSGKEQADKKGKSDNKGGDNAGSKSGDKNQGKPKKPTGGKTPAKPATPTKTQTKTQAKTQPKPQTGTSIGTNTGAATGTGTGTGTETQPQTNTGTQTETTPGTQTNTAAETQTAVEPGAQTQTNVDPQTGTQTGGETETQTGTQTESPGETSTSIEPGTQTQAAPETQTSTEPGIQTQSDVDTQPGNQAGMQTGTDTDKSGAVGDGAQSEGAPGLSGDTLKPKEDPSPTTDLGVGAQESEKPPEDTQLTTDPQADPGKIESPAGKEPDNTTPGQPDDSSPVSVSGLGPERSISGANQEPGLDDPAGTGSGEPQPGGPQGDSPTGDNPEDPGDPGDSGAPGTPDSGEPASSDPDAGNNGEPTPGASSEPGSADPGSADPGSSEPSSQEPSSQEPSSAEPSQEPSSAEPSSSEPSQEPSSSEPSSPEPSPES